ncbi:MAG: hypothetical protein WA061_02255 [Microgenomates group bacterium]
MDDRRRRLIGAGVLGRGGATFARTISPTWGSELLSDPGLEGIYTAGLCAGFSKGGSPTVSQSADVHGGAKAQEFTAVANSNGIHYGSLASVVGFEKISAWSKRTAGASGKTNIQHITTFGTIKQIFSITWADYTQIELVARNNGASDLYPCINRDASVFDTVIVDDISHKKLTLSTALATPKTHDSDAIVRAGVTVPVCYQGGVAMNLNSLSTPTYGVLAYVDGNPLGTVGTYAATLDQIINNVWTRLVHAVITYVAGASIEVRNVGNTYQLWYNGAQIGADQTISDATIRAGTIATQFATSPNVIFASYAP